MNIDEKVVDHVRNETVVVETTLQNNSLRDIEVKSLKQVPVKFYLKTKFDLLTQKDIENIITNISKCEKRNRKLFDEMRASLNVDGDYLF